MLSLEYLPARVIWIFIGVIFVGIVAASALVFMGIHRQTTINDYDSCVKAGNAILNTYPEQCKAGDKLYTNSNPGHLLTQ